eukprot:1288690-Amphidinium_carterae.1
MAAGEPVLPSRASHSTFIVAFGKELETLYMTREESVKATLKKLKGDQKDFEAPTTINGLLSKLEAHITAASKPDSFQELRTFAVWQHLTSSEQQTKIAEWRKMVLKDGQAEVSKPKVIKTAPKAVCAKSATASID